MWNLNETIVSRDLVFTLPSQLVELPMPLEPSFGPSSTGNQTPAPDILSMEGLDNPVEEESEVGRDF